MIRFSNEKLDECLRSCGMTGTEVAKLAGITPQYLSRLRKGQQAPSAELMANLAFALNKPLDYFFQKNCNYKCNQEASA